MDYLQQRYTQLTVTGTNTSTRTVNYSVRTGWQTPTTLAGLNSAFQTSGAAPTYAYVFRIRQPIPFYTRLTVATPFTDTSMTLTSDTPANVLSSIQAGDVVVLTLRAGGTGILATNLTGSTLRNIKIYAGSVGLRSVGDTSFNGGTALPNGSTVVFEQATDGSVLGSAMVVSKSSDALRTFFREPGFTPIPETRVGIRPDGETAATE